MRYIQKTILSLWAILATIGMMSCSEKVEEPDLQPIPVSTESITFEGVAQGQQQVVTFTAPSAWIAEIHSIVSWLKADVMHGEAGEARIVLTARSDNFSVGVREAELHLLADNCLPAVIHVVQKSAATGDIQVEGLTEDGLLLLEADETGTEFRDTLWVTSSKRWTLATGEGAEGVISFETDGSPRQGEETRVQLIVKADYSKFEDISYAGLFYIRTEDGLAVPIQVKASAKVSVYDKEYSMGDEAEQVSFQLINTVQNGVFMTDCYIESNIRWTIGSMPEWVETGVAMGSVTNVQSSGLINPLRQHVAFRVKESALSRDGRTGTVTLVDVQGRVVKTIYLTFAGVGSGYIDSRLYFPALDPLGNPFGFEAKAGSIDPNNPDDSWKQVRREFDIVTSSDYTSLANAPFHLLLVRADNGIARRQEAHWVQLEYVGRKESDMQGLYRHTLAIRVHDRGDEDDQSGLSDETLWRYALAVIVPRNVIFEDLWDGDGQLRERYANVAVLLAQKNNVDADYKFAFDEVAEGGTLTVPAKGGSLKLHITPGSFTQCGIVVQQQNATGEWVNVDSKTCQIDIDMDSDGQPKSVLFVLDRNKGEVNPFTGQVVGSDRHLRVCVQAFLGDAVGSKTVFTFYIDQELDK